MWLTNLATTGPLWDAEHALATGDPADAVAAAALVPADDPDRPLAALVALEAHPLIPDPPKTGRNHAARELLSTPLAGRAVAALARLGATTMQVAPDDPWWAEAYALQAASEPDPRYVLGAVHALASRPGYWFAPDLAVREAWAWTAMCRQPEADAALLRARTQTRDLDRALALAEGLDDEVLWTRWAADLAWPDAAIHHLVVLDPLSARALARAVDPALRPDAVAWIRRALADARADGVRALSEPTDYDQAVARSRCEGAPIPTCSPPGWPRAGRGWRCADDGRCWYAAGWHREIARHGCFEFM